MFLVARCFSHLRTAFLANKSFTYVPATKLIGDILHAFRFYGIITASERFKYSFKVFLNPNFPFLLLSFPCKHPRDQYISWFRLRTLASTPFGLISTSQGLLTIRSAYSRKLGGILLCAFKDEL